MTELEMFTKLSQLDENCEKDPEGGYLPILIKCIDDTYLIRYYSYYTFNAIYTVTADTPEEAIRKAYEWCKSNNLL